ncbi:MAG: 30S ribosomal protein S12 methylthiotransferase RimO [candidate division WOR-3 bacterium]
MKVSLISLGCPKNLIDSEILLGYLVKSNYTLTADWQNSDVCIVNTCAFINSAVKEAEQWIAKALAHKKQGHIKKVIVAGCLCQRYQHTLLNKFPDIDGIIGIDNLAEINKVIVSKEKIIKIYYSPHNLYNHQTPRLISTNHYAYLKIADGCDNFCSYCLIPYIRGPFRSRKITDIVKEAKQLAQFGVKELILVAQDTTRYGEDIYHQFSLARLLKHLVRIKDIQWFRVLYTHPAHWTDDLIKIYQNNPKICRYVDLPLQHISDRLLRLMNRPYNRKMIEKLLAKLKKIPDIAIRTSLIVGFPGETDKDFEELLEFIKEQQFTHLGCFKYSREKGTIAYNLPYQLSEKIKKERYDIIMKTQQQISLKRMNSFVGKSVEVIIDRKSPARRYNYLARTQYDAPDIDGVVYLKTNKHDIGAIQIVKIIAAQPYALIAE